MQYLSPPLPYSPATSFFDGLSQIREVPQKIVGDGNSLRLLCEAFDKSEFGKKYPHEES